MEKATTMIKELARLETALREELLNRDLYLVLDSGKVVRGRVVWVGGGNIDLITEKGLVTLWYENVLEIRRKKG
ncbi:MAG: hypothetical protein ACP5LX_06610 [Nitrososphaeria archaeon]|jgi:hypothetical protein